jgi:hypothetical protein
MSQTVGEIVGKKVIVVISPLVKVLLLFRGSERRFVATATWTREAQRAVGAAEYRTELEERLQLHTFFHALTCLRPGHSAIAPSIPNMTPAIRPIPDFGADKGEHHPNIPCYDVGVVRFTRYIHVDAANGK